MCHIASKTFFTGVENIWVALMAAKAEVEFDASKILPSQVSVVNTNINIPRLSWIVSSYTFGVNNKRSNLFAMLVVIDN